MIFRVILVTFLCLFSLASQARVFNFGQENLAPYLVGRGGYSSINNQPYSWQQASTYAGDAIDLIYGGEFGVYFRGGIMNIGAGILVQTMDAVTGARISDGSGNLLYTVDTTAMVYGPTFVFEFELAGTPTAHWFLSLGGGYQWAKIENQYSYAATGQALVGGQTSATESYRSEMPFATAGFGYEFHLSGSTTMHFFAGYHYSQGAQWKYGEGGQNLAGGHNQGGDALLEDGTQRKIDWSYPYLQIGFRSYIDTIR
ncbi:MAG: hypothetical protein KDD33_01130 [Bdellovibrionales bacterium]|nr:hypothetical protein [Bdellovibrionales bacterium]